MLIYTTLNWLNLPQKDLSESEKEVRGQKIHLEMVAVQKGTSFLPVNAG